MDIKIQYIVRGRVFDTFQKAQSFDETDYRIKQAMLRALENNDKPYKILEGQSTHAYRVHRDIATNFIFWLAEYGYEIRKKTDGDL